MTNLEQTLNQHTGMNWTTIAIISAICLGSFIILICFIVKKYKSKTLGTNIHIDMGKKEGKKKVDMSQDI